MKTISQCPICKRYLTTDPYPDNWVHLKPKEMAMLILFGDQVDFNFKLCEDCDNSPRRGL